MQYIDELRDGASEHFTEWLRGLAAGDHSARAAAWGLRLDLGGLSPAVAFERVAEAVDMYASRHRVLYAASCFGGAFDNEDAIESALGIMAVAVAEKTMPEAEREARRRARIVARIREGSWTEDDIDWLEIKAAMMTDAEVLAMEPFDGVGASCSGAGSSPRPRRYEITGRGGGSSQTNGTCFSGRPCRAASTRRGTACCPPTSTSSARMGARPSS